MPAAIAPAFDLVVVFRLSGDASQDTRAWRDVVTRLVSSGLEVDGKLVQRRKLVAACLYAPDELMEVLANRARVADWLHNVPTLLTRDLITKKGPRSAAVVELTPAERLRLVHALVTGDPGAGGLGIRAGTEGVEAVMGLQDQNFNKSWLAAVGSKWALTEADLTSLRDHHGERVAFYFAFVHFYTRYLAVPSVIAVLVHFLLRPYSGLFATFIVLWSIVFIQAWFRKARDLALLWRTKNVSRADQPRPGFVPERPVINPLTGTLFMPDAPLRRWILKLTVSIPFVLASSFALFLLNLAVFGIETWAYEYYEGPHATLFKVAPIIAYAAGVGPISEQLTRLAKYLTLRENYETVNGHNDSITAKIFLFNAVTGFSYLAFLLYFYYPLAGRYWFLPNAPHPERLKAYIQYYLITAQIVQFVQENLQPVIVKQVVSLFRSRAASAELDAISDVVVRQIREEIDRPEWDPYGEYAELVSQFGYVAMFALGLPLGVVFSLVNNFLELRGDLYKLIAHLRRPIPVRVESPGQWHSAMLAISFFAAITNGTLVGMFPDPPTGKPGEEIHLNIHGATVGTLVAILGWLAANSVLGGAIAAIPLKRQAEIDKMEVETRELLLRMLDVDETKQIPPSGDPAKQEAALGFMNSLYKNE
ncbi:calcium-activated chloride channel-domain-containing protein [Hyaloraphidium curvatum]|nr:calcium-activated chloride channel-domain-containing protein [Hyaloraphidium curvatum]